MKPVWVRQALVGSLILVYALLAHYSNAAGDAPVLGAILAVAPLVLVALMFVGEHMVRRRVVPSMRSISLADTVRAYILFSRSRTAPRI